VTFKIHAFITVNESATGRGNDLKIKTLARINCI
jgi:hypothetical protein